MGTVSFWQSEMKVQLCFALLPLVVVADFYRVDTEVLAKNDDDDQNRHPEDVTVEGGSVEAKLESEVEQEGVGSNGRPERDSDAQFFSLGGSTLLNGPLQSGVVASPSVGLVGTGRHVNLGNGGVGLGLGGARLGTVGLAGTGLGGVGVGHRHVNLGNGGVGLGGARLGGVGLAGTGLGGGHRHVNLGSGGVSHLGHGAAVVASPVVAAAPAVVASAPAAAVHHNHVNLGPTHAAVHAAPALVQPVTQVLPQAPALVASQPVVHAAPAVHVDAAGPRHVNLGGGAQTTLAAAPAVVAPAVVSSAVVAPAAAVVQSGVHVDSAGVRHVNLGNTAHTVAHAAPAVVAHAAPAVAVAPVVSHGVGHATVHAAPAVVSHGVGHVSHGIGGHSTVHAAPAAVAVHTPVAQTAALAVHHHHTPAVVAHSTPVVAHSTPVVSATTHHHVPVTHTTHAVTYGAGGSADSEVYPDEIIPYSYEYTVSDPETNNNFNAVESDDGTGVRSGSYSVSLPDSRIQHVVYTTDADGYVATVTYEGTAVFPDLV